VVNASLPVHPIPSPPLERVLPATQIARHVPELRSINVQAAHLTGPYFPMAAASRRAPRRSSSTLRVEVVSHATAAARVAPALDRVIALRAQARPQSSAEDLAWQPTAMRMARLRPPPPASSLASACVFRILSRPRRSQGRLASPGSTRQSILVAVSRGGKYYS